MKKWWIALAGVIGFFVLLVFLSFLFAKPSDVGTAVPEEMDLQLLEAQDPERGEVREVIVPARRVPTTFSERLRAPAITLLPNHLRAPEARAKVSLPASERKAITSLLYQFLKAYETYSPGDDYDKSWQKSWEKMVVEERRSDLARRADSNDYPGVCPYSNCLVGSRWAAGVPPVFLIDFSARRAYLSGYGAVRYTGDPRLNSLAAGSTERAYGILLVKKGKKWFVERLAAESLR